MTIIAYQKYISPQITRELNLPRDVDNHAIGTELATLADGFTYVSLPTGAVLPTVQPSEISASISTVVLTAAQIAEIKAISPHVRLINKCVRDKISEKYSATDEIGFVRLGAADPGYAAYNAHVESCRAWGHAEKAKLGL